MRALIVGFKDANFLDGLGFIDRLASLLSAEIDAYGFSTYSDVRVKGLKEVYVVQRGTLDALSKALSSVARHVNADLIVSPATKNGVDILARASSDLNIPFLKEVNAVFSEGGAVFLGCIVMGGRAIAKYKFKAPIALTVAQGKFKPAERELQPVVKECPLEGGRMELVEVKEKVKEAVDIEAAEVVVGVGRGFRSKDDLKLAFELASALRGEVGCSRPIAADLGWLSEDRWIGISGKKVKGKLYFAVGISGAPQHMMAASDAKVIVAVNKDPNAPVFSYSDYGVVADLYKFIPVFLSRLRERLSR